MVVQGRDVIQRQAAAASCTAEHSLSGSGGRARCEDQISVIWSMRSAGKLGVIEHVSAAWVTENLRINGAN